MVVFSLCEDVVRDGLSWIFFSWVSVLSCGFVRFAD